MHFKDLRVWAHAQSGSEKYVHSWIYSINALDVAWNKIGISSACLQKHAANLLVLRGQWMNNTTDIAKITTDLFNLLKPLEPEDRAKVVQAALTLLGDSISLGSSRQIKNAPELADDEGIAAFAPKVNAWLTRSGLTEEGISQVFHIEGESAEIILADLPGRSAKEKVISAYVLTGIGRFLTTGDAKFDDEAAREVCKAFGCLDVGNHSKYIKDKGNVMGGSKAAGWTLTAPGFKTGADLIKNFAPT